MNLPNALTLSRFFMAGIMIALLFASMPFGATCALLVFGLAALTDWLDGHLARKFYGITALGQLLDPLADKVLVCAALVSFVEIRLPGARHPLIPAWIVVLILAREFMVTGLRVLAVRGGRDISAGPWGKQKTIWQIVAIIAMLLGLAIQRDLLPYFAPEWVDPFDLWFARAAYVMALAVAAITVASGAIYFHQHRDLLRSAR
jgi:CDP-diacylglycerol--glycerol-3-phosphate 3-phosphatidyltransferase